MNVRLQEVGALAAALGAAQACGLLASLSERPGSAAELAARCDIDASACARVLDIFSAFGLTTIAGDQHRAGEELMALARVPQALGRIDIELWKHAPTFLRTGTPLFEMDSRTSAERAELYRDVVPELGRLFSTAAEHLAERFELTPQSILDIGCGSGVWSLALARRLPNAHVTGLDLPNVIDQFLARAASFDLADRVDTITGDFHVVALPERKWDLAIIANVIRLEQPDVARALIARAVAAIRPGGSLLVVDALADGTVAARQARALYAFHLAMRTRSGKVHSAADVARWMQDSGCDAPTELMFDERTTAVGALGAVIARKR